MTTVQHAVVGTYLHVDDVGADSIQEVLGVRDDHQNALKVGQSVLQPHARFQVCGGRRAVVALIRFHSLM